MFDLDQTIKNRHSTRKFLSQPVPRTLLDEALTLAQHAPSNSNIQPWRVVFAEGVRRDRLQEALLNQAKQQQPNIPPLPEAFQHYRQELGTQVYGAMGIAREDKANRQLAVLRNYEFFGAPVVGIICMHQDLSVADALSVGMYLQTLILCLTARGLGTCAQVSLAGYPEIIRNELNIPPELLIICGLAVGYSDPDFPANHLHTSRESVEKNVTFLDH
ncbi:MAG: nitroreductase [Stigonema ocellatum SAG 48.90 = DSM 106950]|nr:nitroreductase [Stigonema ocellatum SAG 48.90 = DSM 106950]